MKVKIDCKTKSGKKCEKLEWPVEKCSSEDGELDVLTFIFEPSDCTESYNRQAGFFVCSDTGSFGNGPVTISCNDPSGAPVTVEPVEVSPDETFTVTNPSGGSLPTSIACSLLGSSGPIQDVSIDTSGLVNLELKDKFGSMSVVSCDDITCIEELTYTYNFNNLDDVRSTDMEVNVALRYFNSETFDLLPSLPINPLEPAQSTSIEEKITIDVCEQTSYCADVYARGRSKTENGAECDAEDQRCLQFL